MKKTAEELCAGVRTLHDEAVSLAEAAIFMAKKLDEEIKILKNEPLVIEYDNGGGQKGIRENPRYVAYEHLQNTYNKTLRQLTEIVEKGAPTAAASSVLLKLNTIAGKKVG